jgi:hypothetical protein
MEIAPAFPSEPAPGGKRALLPGGITADEEADLRREQASDIGGHHTVLDRDQAASPDAGKPGEPGLREAQRGVSPANDVGDDDELGSGSDGLDGGEERTIVEGSTLAVGGPGAIVERIGKKPFGPKDAPRGDQQAPSVGTESLKVPAGAGPGGIGQEWRPQARELGKAKLQHGTSQGEEMTA